LVKPTKILETVTLTMGKKFSLGTKLRAVRDERNLSQSELAQRSGLSSNAISLIERDKNSPSVATLQSLAAALNVKMSFFFEDEESQPVLHVKKGERPTITSKGVKIEGIGGALRHQEMEPFRITLEPRSKSGDRQVVHTGHEFVYCLRGVVEYIIDGTIYHLEAGDFLMFEAHLPHIWRNTTDREAEFILVLQTPGESDEPVKRHFSSYPSMPHMG
jgi:transcriptional regulator with XRE-family HTH domain